jgi:nicotinamidase-related amidase
VSGILQLRARHREELATGQRSVERDVAIEVGSAALLLVDVYPRQGSHADVVRELLVPARAAARRAGIRVVYVTNHLAASTAADSQWTQLWQRTLGESVLETWKEPSDVLTYLPEIAPGQDDHVVRKQHYSGFYDTGLEELLRSHGVDDVIIAGFDARICVAATATDALARDFRVLILRDGIGTTEMEPGVEEAGAAMVHALRYLEVCAGSTVTTRDFIVACARSSDAPRG